jgi:hypothetical protein
VPRTKSRSQVPILAVQDIVIRDFGLAFRATDYERVDDHRTPSNAKDQHRVIALNSVVDRVVTELEDMKSEAWCDSDRRLNLPVMSFPGRLTGLCDLVRSDEAFWVLEKF